MEMLSLQYESRHGGEFVIDFSAIPLSEGVQRLLADETEEFEAVLGRSVSFRPAQPGESAWVVEVPEGAQTLPQLRWESPDRLVSVAGTEQDLVATINAMHSLAYRDTDTVTVEPAASVSDAVALIRDEIANTYPYFALRDIDWDDISARHVNAVPHRSDFASFAAAWVAELGDAHTGIKTAASGGFNPPYRGTLESDGVHLSDVPTQSAASEAGVRSGWVVDIDGIEHLMQTVGASPQQISQVRARRAMAFKARDRMFIARNPANGQEVQWTEHSMPATLENTVEVTRQDRDLAVRVRAFDSHVDLHSVFDELFGAAGNVDHLTLDLRGNTGGSILLATDLRDRFLRSRTRIGCIAFTDGRGGLAPKQERWADPSERPRWPGTLEILTDSMTYSASEDFILGLQGLEHVTVRGSVTGGGSGRPRRIPILPGIDLTISTAITYDRRGNPVEFRGIHPDNTE